MKINSSNWRAGAIAAALAFCSIAAPSPAHAQESIYSPDDQAFAVSFPGKPDCVQQDVGTPGGALTVHVCTFANLAAQLFYGLTYMKVPPAKATMPSGLLLRSAMQGEAAATESRVLEADEVTIDGYPGLRSKKQDPDGLITISHYFLAEGRLITLTLGGWEGRMPPAVASSFFSSFKLSRHPDRQVP